MKKRLFLWGVFTVLMLSIVFVMVKLADTGSTAAKIDNTTDKRVVERPGLLQLNEADWTRGSRNADVVIIKYSDFQCSACRAYASFDHFLIEEMGDEVLFVYRYFPLRNFKFSRLAATYAEAAGRQEKFWEMHDLLYINQPRWQLIQDSAEPMFREFAQTLNLDMEQLDKDLQDSSISKRIEFDYEKGRELGVNAVPSIFINGKRIQNPRSLDAYRTLLESHFK